MTPKKQKQRCPAQQGVPYLKKSTITEIRIIIFPTRSVMFNCDGFLGLCIYFRFFLVCFDENIFLIKVTLFGALVKAPSFVTDVSIDLFTNWR